MSRHATKVAVGLCAAALAGCAGSSLSDSGGRIRVVAAENFYGSIVAQIGGPRVQVTSIIKDPSADPHEYTGNVEDTDAVARARLVVVNGAGYDTFMDKLVAASP